MYYDVIHEQDKGRAGQTLRAGIFCGEICRAKRESAPEHMGAASAPCSGGPNKDSRSACAGTHKTSERRQMTPAIGYLRVSGRSQIDGDGFPRQRVAIERFAAANSLQLRECREEKGVSGTVDGMDRPTWVELVAYCQEHKGTVIVIERLDRLARDLMIQEHIIKDLQNRGVQIISVNEPDLSSDDPTRKLFRQIMGAIAEYDKKMVVLKLRAARSRKKLRGEKAEGAYPFGAHPHMPEEASTLERILDLHRSGLTFNAVTSMLNQQGLKPRRGARWSPTAVQRILERAYPPKWRAAV